MARDTLIAAALAGICALAPQAALAQEQPGAGQSRIVVPSPVLTLDWETLYDQSQWGIRVRREIAAASRALNAENNRIADDLVAEERALTDRRPAMDPKAFRLEADAFDTRATEIRAAQKAKAQAIQTQLEQERQAFIQSVVPVLDTMLTERGAVVVLDRRAIIRGLANIDVTEDLVTLIDRDIGDGAGVVAPLVTIDSEGAGADAPAAGPAPTDPSAH